MDKQRLIFVAAAVVQLAFWIILAGCYRTPAAAPGSVVLRYGWKLRLLGLCIAFGTPMWLIVVQSTMSGLTSKPVLPLSAMLLAAGLVGGALLMETQGVYLLINDAAIVGVSPWRKRREWRWPEIERVAYSRLNRSLVLHGPRRERLQASLALLGIADLAQALLQHVAAAQLAPARAILERLAGTR